MDALHEPRVRALIACQVQSGPDMTWEDRTYEVFRSADGQWRIDFGYGEQEPRSDWDAVLRWFAAMRPRAVEMLEVA